MRPLRWLGVALLGLAALSAPALAAPEQLHVSLEGQGLAVSWARPGDVTGGPADAVEWTRGDGQPATRVLATAQLIEPGTTLFTATVPVANGTVQYRVGSDEAGWSPTRTVRLPGPDRLRVAVYGDHGTGLDSEASVALVPRVAAEAPDLVLHAGDLSYADGEAHVWDTWFRLIEPLAATVPYMAAAGNHEHEGYYPASAPNASLAPAPGSLADPYHQFRSRFAFPGDELRYSFDAGPVHVLVINSEDLCATQPATTHVPWRVSPPCDPGTSDTSAAGVTGLEQAQGRPNQDLLDFVRADLEAHARRPWTFVVLHRPVHSAGSYVGDPILQRHFAPLFEQFGVDLVLTGHDHTYQRSHPLRGLEPAATDPARVPKGLAPVYIVTGGGGEGLYTLQPDTPDWTAARAGEYHHLLIDVTPDGLHAQVIETMNGTVIDAFTIGSWSEAPVAAEGQDAPGVGAWLAVACVAAALASRRRSS